MNFKIKKKTSSLQNIMLKKSLLSFLILTQINLYSQNATKYSNEFLQLGVGARSLALGGSTIANGNDVYSAYWNPAALTSIENKRSQAALMHSAYFGGIANYDYGAFATKLSKDNAFAISLIRFGIDGIPNTFDLIRNGEIDYSRVTSFNATDFAALVSYASDADLNIRAFRHLSFSWGTNMKIIRRKVGSFGKATGFGLDVGTLFKNEKQNWSIGLTLRDATSTFNSWRYYFTDAQKDVLAATNNRIPVNTLEITVPRLLAGFNKKFELNNWIISYEIGTTLFLDGKRNTLLRTNAFSTDFNNGLEIGYVISDKNSVYFRLGTQGFQKYTNHKLKHNWSVSPTTGIGLKFGNFTLDYALTNYTSLINQTDLFSNVFSLKFEIEKPKS